MAQSFIFRRPAKKVRYVPQMASIQSLADPTGSSALVNAVQWLQGTLLGTVASTVAIIAVTVVGVQMLFGRISYRRGLNVVIGCFVIFGATSIAAGIRSTIAGENLDTGPVRSYERSPLPPAIKQAPVPAYDPYAGASVPTG